MNFTPGRIATFSLVAVVAAGLATAQPAATIAAAEAKDHIGERATVCGKVVDSRHASSSRGRPTFLNLDKPYPRHVFTAVIWGEDRHKFDEPEKAYRDKTICVTGTIDSYHRLPQIVVNNASQIEVKKAGTQ
jgi:hypothetical protein